VQVFKPTWSSWSLLVYTGGLTVLGAAAWSLAYLSAHYGDFAYAAWALLILAVILAVANRLHAKHPVTAGVFAFVAVPLWVAFLAALWAWWGWSLHTSGGSPFAGFHISRLAIFLLALAFSKTMVDRFRAPFSVVWVTLFAWLFITDLISNGGNWSTWVSLLLGVLFLISGMTKDSGEKRPLGFWRHVAAGLLIGGALLDWWHSGSWHWAFIAVAGVLFIRLAVMTRRSSWAVFGVLGILAAATHFDLKWSSIPTSPASLLAQSGGDRGWVSPLVFGITGFLIVLIGFWVSRRERR
jgi:hypothetical protein